MLVVLGADGDAEVTGLYPGAVVPAVGVEHHQVAGTDGHRQGPDADLLAFWRWYEGPGLAATNLGLPRWPLHIVQVGGGSIARVAHEDPVDDTGFRVLRQKLRPRVVLSQDLGHSLVTVAPSDVPRLRFGIGQVRPGIGHPKEVFEVLELCLVLEELAVVPVVLERAAHVAVQFPEEGKAEDRHGLPASGGAPQHDRLDRMTF